MNTVEISGEEYQVFLQFKKLVADKPQLAEALKKEAFWNHLASFLSIVYESDGQTLKV